ncbi:MAG: DUF502 domain-containing protein [Rhodospirillales bacterium]|jgi:uncharacterized membrane protein|nr:DUF502 domain-containing protein [Rhodospirillales bacterium]
MNDDSADRPAGPQDDNDPGPSETGSEKPSRNRFGARLRTYFFAGILVTAPISITFYLAWLLISFVDRRITPLIPEQYNPESYLPFALPGLGVVIMVVGLTLIGAVTAGFVGRLWMRISERLLSGMPVIRNIYATVKQIIETIVAQKSQAFREAVLVEYPRRGIWAIGFMTGKTEGEVQNLTKETVTNVFLPTTPNPTSGFLLFVPTKDLVPLSMTVEEAIKMVISGGIVTPADQRPKSVRDVPVVSAATFEELDILREQDGVPVLATKKD